MVRISSFLCLLLAVPAGVQGSERTVQVMAVSRGALGEWSPRIESLEREGRLALRQTRADTMLEGRRHDRLVQLHQGIPVFGAELSRQSDAAGTLTVFGTLYEGIELSTTPSLSPRKIESILATRGGRVFGERGGPELGILPLEDGSFRLAYRVRAVFLEPFALRQSYVDAHTGEVLFEYDDIQRQVAALGTGVLGDTKKLSVSGSNGSFTCDDRLRPPVLRTYDFRMNYGRFLGFLNGDVVLAESDLARDEDNVWTDGAVVDAHAYTGLAYDYFYKRFGRKGLDDANIPIRNLTHGLSRYEWRQHLDVAGDFLANAIYLGEGYMFYGDGLPLNVRLGGKTWDYTAGSLDVVVHELSHGVTDYSSRLIYSGDYGALNESFSDIMATGAEFCFQPDRADYLIGEDVVKPGGVRSLANPMAYGDPDHYSIRYTGSADNGGVHSNSGIANHAFYLAIEGGRHRLGASVAGVGAANRDKVEKAFYRAFVFLMGPQSGFSHARATTLQAARELYGAGSNVETAIDQAWRAVGIE